MANENGGLGEGLDIGWAPRADVNKVTEEAVTRIADEARQAKQTQQQIKQDKANNNKLAEFLSYLIKNITNEHITKLLYEVFFKIKDPKTQVTYLRKKINTMVLIWLFYPYYPVETREFWIDSFYAEIYDFSEVLNLTSYLEYIKRLSAKYHDNIALDSEWIMNLILEISIYYWLFEKKHLSQEEHAQAKLTLQEKLYWTAK